MAIDKYKALAAARRYWYGDRVRQFLIDLAWLIDHPGAHPGAVAIAREWLAEWLPLPLEAVEERVANRAVANLFSWRTILADLAALGRAYTNPITA